MPTVTVNGNEAATNTDVLNGTRLVTVPPGKIIIECVAADNVAANHYTVSLTLPGGQAPWLDILVPGNATAGLGGVMDDRQSLTASFLNTKEGHVTLSFTETGDTEVFWQVTSQS